MQAPQMRASATERPRHMPRRGGWCRANGSSQKSVETPLAGLGDPIGSLHDFGAPYVGPLALHFANRMREVDTSARESHVARHVGWDRSANSEVLLK